MRRSLASLIIVLMTCLPALAKPVPYALQAAESVVGYEVDFGPDVISGKFPIKSADIRIDFKEPGQSTVAVVLDVTGADASFPFAAQALRGPRVLDAQQFPELTFTSTSVKVIEDGVVEIGGDLTIRGVTRPVVLRAETYRQTGSAVGDFSRLTMILTGVVNRSDYGADGWSDQVGDQVRMRITARIERVD